MAQTLSTPLAHTLPPLPYSRRARAAHRRADDADPPRQASPGVRQQPERGASRRRPQLAGMVARGPAARQHRTKVPEAVRTAVRNNGGGHWNHSLFWTLMHQGRRQRATWRARGRDQRRVRRCREVQGAVRRGGRRPLRLGLGVAGRRRTGSCPSRARRTRTIR